MRFLRATTVVVICASCDSANRTSVDPPEQVPDVQIANDVEPAPDSSEAAEVGVEVDQGGTPNDHADIEWVRIEGGTFQMGPDPLDEDEILDPPFRVEIPTFDIMKTEVTVAQYGRCFDAGVCPWSSMEDPGGYCPKGPEDSPDLPMRCISWDEAQGYARWVGSEARLPTDSEWEFVARGRGRGWEFPWGDARPTCERAIMSEFGGQNGCGRHRSWPVCSRPLGNSVEGICDLSGNISEWTEDYFIPDSTQCTPRDGKPCLQVTLRHVIRGGNFGTIPKFLSARAREGSGRPSEVTGFRLVRPVAPESWRKSEGR